MRIHDSTLTLDAGMATWPGEAGPALTPISRIAGGAPANVSLLTLGDHTGTHVDPPVHFIEGEATVDELPLGALVGLCDVVRYAGDAPIDAEWLGSAGIPADAERVLFRMRNSKRWADPAAAFDPTYVALAPDAAHWLVARGIVLVAIDYLSIEPCDSATRGFPVHHTLLAAGVVVVEGVDLRGIRAGRYEIACGPLKVAHGTGGPARVFLIERD